jgi:hypothetical protein
VASAQKSRDLLYREAAHKHVAQLGQLRVRPFPFRVSGRLFVLNSGALRIDYRGANDAESSFLFGMRRPSGTLTKHR